MFLSFISAQSPYPADTIFHSNEVTLLSKLFLYPITKWQRISYKSNRFNCQFFPSCSNYYSNSLKNYGVILGSIIATDRIIRCNHSAFYYHKKMGGNFNKNDKRLIDLVKPKNYNTGSKSSSLAGALSIIPGLGRIYSGRFYDAIYSITNLSLSAKLVSISGKNNITYSFSAGIFSVIYLAEIYGAYRSARFYQPPEKEQEPGMGIETTYY